MGCEHPDPCRRTLLYDLHAAPDSGQARACMLYSFRRSLKLPTISATSAFMGATYTILNALVSTVPSAHRCRPICSIGGQQLFAISGHQLFAMRACTEHTSRSSTLSSAATAAHKSRTHKRADEPNLFQNWQNRA